MYEKGVRADVVVVDLQGRDAMRQC